MFASLWILVTVAAAGAQTLRNALQRGLTETLGTLGATNVRFLFGLPFALLFLAVGVVATGSTPAPESAFWGWAAAGGTAQIAGTAAMLAAMRERSFLVAIAYTKSEPVQVALFSLAFLGEVPTPMLVTAILVATLGVTILSWPKRIPDADAPVTPLARVTPALLGIASGGFFALSAVAFKGAIRGAHSGNFVVDASTALAVSQAIQTALLTGWLAATRPAVVGATLRAWRASLGAGFMGAFASQMWFTAFAVAPVAAVRTLGLVEILFAQALSRSLMKERPSRRDLAGVALLGLGVALVLRA